MKDCSKYTTFTLSILVKWAAVTSSKARKCQPQKKFARTNAYLA
jgi:hypothetical protein